MRKLLLLVSVAAAMALARPALAQTPLSDVPANHWAYDAVNELASRGIITGYPEGTFGGKRAVNRYELAAALQRVLQDVERRIGAPPTPRSSAPAGVTREQLEERLRNVPSRE